MPLERLYTAQATSRRQLLNLWSRIERLEILALTFWLLDELVFLTALSESQTLALLRYLLCPQRNPDEGWRRPKNQEKEKVYRYECTIYFGRRLAGLRPGFSRFAR